ncbi:glycoside hydrolase family 31 protein [Botryobacter ruber]|uniref:glycoside hydrolase family 31 protein n=1 Tax=Botryobacter ruber TaxID=2171629 RepID=UPI000E0C0BE3|nr:glycoside hydrolase family 31 protein [Botryobacter ruber]
MKHFLLLLLAAYLQVLPLQAQPETQQTKAQATAAQSENATNPVANPKAVVVAGNARFTVLTPELIRMEYAAGQDFTDKASLVFINRNLPVPKFTTRRRGKNLVIRTNELTLTYTQDGQPFNAQNLTVEFKVAGRKVTWKPGMEDTQNLKGTMRTLDQVKGWDGEKKLEPGLLSRSGWALINDSKTNLFDGATDWNWVTPRQNKEVIDWYLFAYGHNYKQALQDFTKVAGKIPMPPRYAFGYWWSRYWIYSDSELRELVKQIRSYDIPLDVLVIDMDWHETYGFSANNPKTDPMGQWVGWTGYTWNKNLFPEPAKFLQWTNEENLKTTLNLHPASGISPMEEQYADFARAYAFDTTGSAYIPFAMSDKKWAKTYFDIVLEPMEKMGVDFWWLDWQQYLEDKQVKGLSNTWWLNYTFFTDMARKGNKRPMLFHRWGGMGNHRYQIGFSGDAHTTWETLDFETYFTSTASNVGYGYWSHDIGGHITGGPTEGEMYLRWIQFGVLSPILRTHASKISELERRFWKFPAHFAPMRDAVKFRYALAPYIYKNSRVAYDTGISLCRPMYYDYPNEDKAYTHKTQYMFGDDMLAAPVTTPVAKESLLAERTVWLPQGDDWYEYTTGTLLKGNQVAKRKFSLEEVPLYMKAGSIIPMYTDVDNLQEVPVTQVLAFVPGTQRARTQVYEDDGITDNYKTGAFATRTITRENISDKAMKIVVEPVKGSYEGMPQGRAFELQLLSSIPPAEVIVDGTSYSYDADKKPGTWSYSNHDFYTSIHIPEKTVTQNMEVTVRFDKTFAEQQQVLNGNKGFLQRLAWVTEQLKFIVAEKDWGGTLPNSIYELGNIRNILLYHPERAYPELQQLNAAKAGLKEILLTLPYVEKEKVQHLVKHLELE